MIKIRKNEEGSIVINFDDEQSQVLEVVIQDEQYVAKRGEKMAVSSLKKEPIQLRSATTNEAYFVKKEDKKIHLFNNNGVDLFIQ